MRPLIRPPRRGDMLRLIPLTMLPMTLRLRDRLLRLRLYDRRPLWDRRPRLEYDDPEPEDEVDVSESESESDDERSSKAARRCAMMSCGAFCQL